MPAREGPSDSSWPSTRPFTGRMEEAGPANWFAFHNHERPRQSLAYRASAEIHRDAELVSLGVGGRVGGAEA